MPGIIDLIDGALEDWATSEDAMRWAPAAPEQPLAITQQPDLGLDVAGRDLYRTLAEAAYAVHPMIRHHPQTRWVMDLAWYRRVRAAARPPGSPDPDGDDPAHWEPDPRDCLLGIPVSVTETGGSPHLENPRHPSDP